ncbi:type IV pilus secretin PilQ [Desulfoluna spongiiphila]|uniref:type IV pilus secretin PilQ n=1 Tax=Desulfoluna spongiiphila TaxID=419481 RepID=UPI001255E379|nr:type IV pilus secretin PilQ [Desulfoluna spongiiphila]VVS92687.1 type iv pilus secretin pilq [Desulfoluna spongiiphila]
MFDKTSMLRRQAAAVVLFVFLAALTAGGCASDKGAVTPVVETPSVMAERVITGVDTRVASGEVVVSIQGSAMLTYASIPQSLPPGVVLHFPDADVADGAVQSPVDNAVVETIEASRQGNATQLKILLKDESEYEVVRSGNGLNVVFTSVEAQMPEVAVAAEADDEVPAEASVAEMTVEAEEIAVQEPEAVQAPAVQPVSVGPATVSQIDFTSTQSGASTILIGTTGPVGYKVSKKDEKTLYLKLSDTTLPDSRKRPIITTRFNSAVNRILPVQTEQMAGDALFIIELRDAVPYLVSQSGDQIEVSIDPSSVPPQKEDDAKLPSWKKAITEADVMAVPDAAGSDMAAFPDGASSTAPVQPDVVESMEPEISVGKSKSYSGEKIAVDFFETDIKNVFRIIRAVSGQNFAIDKDVTGQVTMTLQNPVPWDQILDLVLKMNMLGSVKENGITRIATLKTLKEEEAARLQYIASQQFSKEIQKAMAPMSTEYILISYSNAETDIKPHLERILTPERGSVSVDTRTNQLIITDTAEKITQARAIVKQIDRITPQVIIEARIVEASSNFTRAFGVTWNAQTEGYPTVGQGNDSSTLGGVYGYGVAMDYGVDTTNSIGINFSRLTGNTLILDAKLTALETKGTGKIVSSPKVLTLDNKKATIKQGVEIPYQTVEDGDVDIEFKEVELRLEVTPHVTADDRISLQVLIDKNDVGSITDGIPGLNTKGVETELIMNDGETIVIGGIIKSNKTFAESAFPVLSQIPVLGWLFKNRTRTEEKQELLVFLTPRVVKMDELKI